MKAEESDKILSNLFKKHQDELTFQMPSHLKTAFLSNFAPRSKESHSFFAWMSIGGGALATCIAFILVFQLGKMSTNGPRSQIVMEEIVSSHIRSLMVGHISDVESTDQHTVKPWFDGKIDFAPTVKDFAKDNFPLIGGRLDYIDSRPTAALVYKFNQHLINVLQQPTSTSESSKPRLQAIRGYQVFSWAKDGMKYWVVSDLNASDLQRFVYLWF
jgi:anti-sigma factor RsiW